MYILRLSLVIFLEYSVQFSRAESDINCNNNEGDIKNRISLSYDDCSNPDEPEKYELNPIAVYSTAENESIWGCFEDEKEFLSEMKGITNLKFIKGRGTNRVCLGLSPSVEDKPKLSMEAIHYECFYGSRKEPTSLMIGDNLCTIPCVKDDTTFCSGSYRIKVYHAEVKGLSPAKNVEEKTVRCDDSLTTVNRKEVCKGSVIFEEDFNKLDTSRWFHSNFVPWNPDYEFVFFSDNAENSFVSDGKLHIKPKIMSDSFVRQGVLLYKNCTGYEEVECKRRAGSFFIVPPIRSARISTQHSFSFKYGRVDIRAKFPRGDWIYPELWLLPNEQIQNRTIVQNIIIATSRGNPELTHHGHFIGGVVLESGVLLGSIDDIKAKYVKKSSLELWSAQFHNYSVVWKPENIIFMVDDEVIHKIIPDSYENLYEVMELDKNFESWKSMDVPVAPFDQECFLSLGLSVGGIRNFPDNSLSGSYQKPWMNKNTKAMYKFYTNKRLWAETWTEEDSNLQIDSIKITAL